MTRLKPEVEGPDGWTQWQYPLLKGYRMGCCDCGLVHDLEFAVVEIERHIRPDRFVIGNTVIKGNKGKYRIAMRARRNQRSTAQVRRHKKNRPGMGRR